MQRQRRHKLGTNRRSRLAATRIQVAGLETCDERRELDQADSNSVSPSGFLEYSRARSAFARVGAAEHASGWWSYASFRAHGLK